MALLDSDICSRWRASQNCRLHIQQGLCLSRRNEQEKKFILHCHYHADVSHAPSFHMGIR